MNSNLTDWYETESPFHYDSPPGSPSYVYLDPDLPTSSTMRTIYFGGLPPEVTLEEILDHIKGGLIEQARLIPERGCCFMTFLDSNVAAGIFQESQMRQLSIAASEIKIGWGKRSSIPPHVIHAVMNGATRNVFIGNIDHDVTEGYLRDEFAPFGTVDHVKILYEKRIAFVHMAGIVQAMKAVSSLQLNPAWMMRRVHYGRDRCAPNGLNPLASLPPGVIGTHLLKNGDPNSLMAPLNSPGNIPNRTIYIGGIHPDVTTKEICDTIRGGILQHIKYMPEKNIAFVTFVDPDSAVQFCDRAQMEGLSFKGKRSKVGWGKATPLPTSVQLAVQQHSASRNVYIGSIDDTITEEKLFKDFGDFGDIELINIIIDKNIAFINFSDILSAIRAVEVMKNNFEYHRFKINYGKDRCGNAPRCAVFNPQQTMDHVNDQSPLFYQFRESKTPLSYLSNNISSANPWSNPTPPPLSTYPRASTPFNDSIYNSSTTLYNPPASKNYASYQSGSNSLYNSNNDILNKSNSNNSLYNDTLYKSSSNDNLYISSNNVLPYNQSNNGTIKRANSLYNPTKNGPVFNTASNNTFPSKSNLYTQSPLFNDTTNSPSPESDYDILLSNYSKLGMRSSTPLSTENSRSNSTSPVTLNELYTLPAQTFSSQFPIGTPFRTMSPLKSIKTLTQRNSTLW